MQQTNEIKICLIGDMLSDGGAERVTADLSNYFHSQGIEVHIVIIQNKITYPYSGELLNLGLDLESGLFNKVKRFIKLRKYFRKHRFDFVIDFRYKNSYLQEWIINELLYEKKKIVFTVHSSVLNYYIPENNFVARLLFRKAYGLVAVSDKIKDDVIKRHLGQDVKRIYNPVDIIHINKCLETEFDTSYRYVLAVGSMDGNIKQFDLLIESYAASSLPTKGIKLVILGKGKLIESYVSLAEKFGLGDMVVFPGFKDNPYVYMKNALFFVLSSRREGLGMVLIEALACGTPVVSFNCDAGPSEIIQHEYNGLLVKDQDFTALRQAMERMATDQYLYDKCKTSAPKSIGKFFLESVGVEWINYLKIKI
ncbi:glycosyltransferase [Flavobacterium sp. MFBS3-15]|uniref:glycosyltransferase n=1 Tax=Flavobacterium sp. MFBS3-15 TaxID=2989816 RepID=UPI0022368EA0|nr:glycosyltransferase [Flavobacterium sp. MFBS3-15]MCW4468407.1 glycosyltransferase [Flavobacterium sp. MFBS3-15]